MKPRHRNLIRVTSCLCMRRMRKGHKKRNRWGKFKRTKRNQSNNRQKGYNKLTARWRASDYKVDVSKGSSTSWISLLWIRSRKESKVDEAPLHIWLWYSSTERIWDLYNRWPGMKERLSRIRKQFCVQREASSDVKENPFDEELIDKPKVCEARNRRVKGDLERKSDVLRGLKEQRFWKRSRWHAWWSPREGCAEDWDDG